MKRKAIIIGISAVLFTACGNSIEDSKAEMENLQSVREMIEQKEAEQAEQTKETETETITEAEITEETTEITTIVAFEDIEIFSPTLTETEAAETTASVTDGNEKTADIDLTVLSSTMVYSEVYNIMTDPESYRGKTMKINGSFAAFYDSEIDDSYYAVLIADATACCQQGMEFIWNGEHSWPEDYPELDDQVEIYGTFGSYTVGENMYYCIYTDEIVRV